MSTIAAATTTTADATTTPVIATTTFAGKNRLIKSPDAWYSNTTLLYVLRVVQFMPVITALGLLACVTQETSYLYSEVGINFGLATSAISLFYLLVIIMVRVPANLSAVVVLVFEVVMAIMWLVALIVLGVDTGRTNCKWAHYTYSSEYFYWSYDWRSPCRAGQASIGMAGFAFVLFACSTVLFGFNVISPIRAAFGSTLEGTDATAQLVRGCNLAISNRSETQTDIETGVDTTVGATAATTGGEPAAAPVSTESAAVEPTAVEPTAVETTAVETAVVEPAVLSEANKWVMCIRLLFWLKTFRFLCFVFY